MPRRAALLEWTDHRLPGTAAGFGLTALAHTFPLLTLTVLIWTLGEIIGAPVSSAYVANIAPAHLRGCYQGTWGMTWGLAFILGPVLGTRLFSWNPAGFWLICAGLGAAAAVLVLAGRQKGLRN